MIQRTPGKHTYLLLLALALFWGMMNAWADEAKPSKGKGKATADAGAKKETSKEALTGTWSGTYTREGSANAITLDLIQKGETVTGSLIVDAGTLPIDKGVYKAAEKKLTFESGPSQDERYQITGTLKGDTLSGEWKGGGQSGPFSVTRAKSSSGG